MLDQKTGYPKWGGANKSTLNSNATQKFQENKLSLVGADNIFWPVIRIWKDVVKHLKAELIIQKLWRAFTIAKRLRY